MERLLASMATGGQQFSGASSIERMLWPFVRLVIGISVVATAATSLAPYHWLAELLANLRIQQCLGLIALLCICIACRRWVSLAIICACLALHLPWFASAFPAKNAIATNAEPLTITLANVLTSNERHDAIIADVLSQSPDFFVILELSFSLANALANRTGSSYPYSIVRPQDVSNFGIGVYSRHPIDESRVLTFGSEIESIGAKIRSPGGSCRVFATHPIPPIGAFQAQWRNDHLEQLAATIQEVKSKDSKTPIVLVGDLNLTPWSPYFEKLETSSGLHRASNRFNVTPTWYRYPSFPFGLVLDHALISDELKCVGHVVGQDIGSDHRSVSVKLVPVD